MSEHEEQEQLPSLAQFLEGTDLIEKSCLLLVEAYHKPDRQETIACLLAAAEDVKRRKNVKVAIAEYFNTVLPWLIEKCHDPSLEKTLANMRAGFEQVNSRLPSAYEERYGQ